MKLKYIFGLFFMCFSLAGCEYRDISSTIYVASYHLANNNEKYQCIFYLPESLSIGKSEDGKNDNKVDLCAFECETIQDLFSEIAYATELLVNFKHTCSVIFDYSFLTKSNLIEFSRFLRDNRMFDYNFYIFASKEFKNLYDFYMINNESVLSSFLLSPLTSTSMNAPLKPSHFSYVVSNLFDDRRFYMPVIDLYDCFSIGGENKKTLLMREVFYFENDQIVLKNIEDIIFAYNFKYYEINVNEIKYSLSNYRIKKQIKKDKLKLKIRANYNVTGKRDNKKVYEEILVNGIKDAIMKESMDFDLLSLNQINKAYKKNYSLEDIEIEVKLFCL